MRSVNWKSLATAAALFVLLAALYYLMAVEAAR